MRKVYYKIKLLDGEIWKDILGLETSDDSRESLISIKKSLDLIKSVLSDEMRIFRVVEESIDENPSLGEFTWPTGKA